jgi:hypothetical protein
MAYHTPKRTIKVLGKLKSLFPNLKFVDTSWNNDACDSIEIDNIKIKLPDGAGRGLDTNRYRIWIPNPDEHNDYSNYVLAEVLKDELDDKETICKTLPALVKEISKLKQQINMDLISAKVDAAAQSKRDKATLYVVSHSDGECTIETKEPSKAGDVLQAVFVNGAEEKEAPAATPTVRVRKGEKLSEAIMRVADKIENKTKTNKSSSMKAGKKAAKKSPIAKKEKGEKKVTRGNNMALTDAQWAKVDKKRGEESFSAFSRGLVLKAIGE